MKRIAYLRVSTHEQRPDRQIDGLKGFCDELHIETISATSRRRPIYERVVDRLHPGDRFVIWDLDRAYRSTRDALTELDRLNAKGIQIQIANLSIDTSTPQGTLIYTIISALAEFERRLLSQRTKEGIAAARKRGKQIGRPEKVSDRDIAIAARKINAGEDSISECAHELQIAPWTLRRRLRALELD